MWPFKKKEEIISKFRQGEQVTFRRNHDLLIGFVHNIYRDKEGQVCYDAQIGGECPAVIYGLKEEELRKYEPYKPE